MSQHTPGPWFIDGVSKIDGSRVISSSTQKWIAAAMDYNTFDRDAEVDANADLIAAAPDLLYALKRAFAVISQHHPENGTCCMADIAMITDAIAKANGGAL